MKKKVKNKVRAGRAINHSIIDDGYIKVSGCPETIVAVEGSSPNIVLIRTELKDGVQIAFKLIVIYWQMHLTFTCACDSRAHGIPPS